MEILIKKTHPEATVPTQATEGDAGYDLYSVEEVTLAPLARAIIKTGISVAIPLGFYGRVAPRSGLALKKGLDVLAGVIDAGYRGDVGVVLINLSAESVTLEKKSKIAQLIIEKCHDVDWLEVDDLSESERGDGGYGSSDVIPDDLSAPRSIEVRALTDP
jgi:dUTP pyrophosphatase